MKTLKNVFITILVLFFSFSAFACGNAYSSARFTAFNTDVYVAVRGILTDGQKDTIYNYLSVAENEFSASVENSFVHAFNDAAENQSVPASDAAIEVLKIAKQANAQTLNAFNPAVYPLVKLWKLSSDTFTADSDVFSPPPSLAVDALKLHTDFSGVIIDDEQNTVSKTDEELKIDLGGLVKGYAADNIYKLLKEWGYDWGYVSVGGSSLYILDAEQLTIRHPRDAASENGIVKIFGSDLKDKPLSTSGDYERFYISDGVRYCHIISPFTGAPVQTGFASVTVLGGSACLSDALSTALCAFERDALVEFVRERLYSFDVYAVYIRDGVNQIITNKKQGENFTLTDDSFTVCEIT